MIVPRPDWVQRLHDRADRLPAAPRVPLHLAAGGPRIGSIEAAGPAGVDAMLAAAMPLARDEGGSLALVGAADAALEAIARWLHAQGLSSRWRDELLDVPDERDVPVARIERAAVRPLGITTRAVHLVGCTPRGDVWLQQRAADKATDPNLWDTLMGGLVSAGESIGTTLERETWEEAGLHLRDLREVGRIGRVGVRRPVAEGYMVEHIEIFEALVPDELKPSNQDGEVQRFEAVSRAGLVQRLEADAFTLEAALVLEAWLAARPQAGGG